MSFDPLPPHEVQRLQALHSLQVLETPPEPTFDALVRAAALLCEVPTSLISLIDRERQWFKARVGWEHNNETPRDQSFCTHAILGTDLLEVPDARLDPRFAQHPGVLPTPGLRFYAGAPIVLSSGHAVGTLCVIDQQPHQLSPRQKAILQELALAAARALEMRREQQQAAELHRAVDRLSLVARRTTNAVIMTDAQGRITWVNEGFVRITGYQADEVLGCKPGQLLQFERTNRTEVQRMRSHLQAERTYRGELLNRGKFGQEYWLDIEIQPLHDSAGALQGFMAVESDITQRKQSELALREYTERFQLAASIAHMGVWEIGVGSGEVVWDAEMCRLYGVPAQATSAQLQEYWRQRVHPDDLPMARKVLVHSLAQARDYDSELRIVLPDGQQRYLRNYARVMCDERGTPQRLIGLTQDVSEQHQLRRTLEQQNLDLQRAQQEAEAASLSKSRFLATVSHEIRTPMHAISGMLQLLQQTPLDARQRDYAHKAGVATRSLLSLVNDILDFSKAEAGHIELDPQPFALTDMLRDVEHILSMNLGTKPLALRLDVPPQLPPSVCGDALRLQQVLLNLGSNAIKFTEQGQVVLAVQCLQQSEQHITLRFSVQDSGIGISPEQQTRIFMAFTQAEASTTRRYGGTGLGLAICKHLVSLMGGDLAVDSALGLGSTFHFTLVLPWASTPVHTPARASTPPPTIHKPHPLASPTNAAAPQRGAAPAHRLAGLRILVVDDNAINLQIATELLHAEGAQVHTAENGLACLAAFEETATTHGFDVVLMDVDMPVMDGLQATRELRRRLGDHCPPVVAMTAHASAVHRQDCLDAGMAEHMGKPFNLDHLVATLQRLTAGAAAAQPLQSPRAREHPLSNAAPLNLSSALQRLGGHQDLLERLLRQFALDLDPQRQRLTQLLAAEPRDPVALQHWLHTLKGVAATLGLEQLAAHAARWEQALLAHPAGPDHPAPYPAAMLAALDATTQALAPYLPTPPVAPSPQALSPSRAEKIALARALLADYDMRGIETLIKLTHAYPGEFGPALAPLQQALDNLDFESAQQLCARLLDHTHP